MCFKNLFHGGFIMFEVEVSGKITVRIDGEEHKGSFSFE